MSISKLKKHLTIIHDKVDHEKTMLPCFASKPKSSNVFMRLPKAITDMIAHGHRDVKFAHFFLHLHPDDSNHTVSLGAKLLHDFEKPPMSSSGVLFKNSRSTPLFEAILKGKENCVASLGTSLPLIPRQRLLPILHVQLESQ